MSSTKVVSTVTEFAGLSDRIRPSNLSRRECPDLLNIDWSERIPKRRLGYRRLHSEPLRTASARFDGYNDYGRIPHRTNYAPAAGEGIYIGIGVVLRGRPVSNAFDKTIYSKGFGGGVNQFARLRYSVATGTNPNGAWVAVLRDVTGAATRTIEVADGSAGGSTPSDEYRFVELYRSTDVLHTLTVWDAYGNVIGTSTAAWTAGGAYVASTEDWTLGVAFTAAATPPAAGASDFASASICEFRYYTGSIANITTRLATTANGWYAQEIDDPNVVGFTGYWKLNDGNNTGTFLDSTSLANIGRFPQQPSSWTRNAAECLGPSALSFTGGGAGAAGGPGSFVWVHDGSAGTSATQTVFNGATARWLVTFVYVPKLYPGTTTVGAQVLCKWGTAAVNANPLRIYINGAQQFEAELMDGANFRTQTVTTAGFLATDLVGKKVRIGAIRTGTVGNGTFILQVVYYDAQNVPHVANSSGFALTAASPNVISGEMAIGRNVTSFVFPFTYGVGEPTFGVIDDLRVVRWTSNQTVYYSAQNQPFTEAPTLPGGLTMILYMRFNEGAGNFLRCEGLPGFSAKIFPEDNDGMRWDIGLVKPYRSPKVALIRNFDSFRADGTTKKSVILKHGATLSTLDVESGVVTPIGGQIEGGICTATQWKENLYVACANGQRPKFISGSSVDDLGIRASLVAPVPALGAGVGFNGTYFMYVTFRNASNANESNPSPGVSFTTAGVQQISSIQVPTSADPQVNQRRIWITLVGGADGSAAFLAATIDDNTTTNYTTAIVAAPVAGTPLEYFLNEEAPQASIISVFRDRAFAAGNQQFPTRVWGSTVGAPWAWDQDASGRYNDLNIDSGDPVTAMWENDDYLLVSIRDGMARLWNTGDSSNPIGQGFLPITHGSVGPASFVNVEGGTFYVSERDIYATDGQQERNVSSPENLQQPVPNQVAKGYLRQSDLPSIQTLMREGLEPLLRGGFVSSVLRSKNQVWFAVATRGSTRNNLVIVYDYVQGVWSKYNLAVDYLAEIDDENDDPMIVGAIEGYICQLDTGNYDGTDVPYEGAISSVSGTTITFSLASPPAALSLRGLTVTVGIKNSAGYIYDVKSLVVYTNTTTTLTYYGSAVSTLKAGDVFSIGPIPAWMDFMLDHGNPMRLKKVTWMRLTGDSDSDDNELRVLFLPDSQTRTPRWTEAVEHREWWPAADTYRLLQIGGHIRNARVRIAQTSEHQSVCENPFPTSSGTITISAFEIESEALPGVP